MADPGAPVSEGERLVVGLVRGVNGLRGMLRVEVLTDNMARFDVGSVLFREDSDSPLTIVSAHHDGPGLLVRFAEISDRPTADRLREAYLVADPEPLAPETYYWHDIIGSSVLTDTGEELGTVADIFRVGEGEVYVVRGPRGEILVPAVAAVVKELAPADKRMVVNAEALGLTNPAENEIKP